MKMRLKAGAKAAKRLMLVAGISIVGTGSIILMTPVVVKPIHTAFVNLMLENSVYKLNMKYRSTGVAAGTATGFVTRTSTGRVVMVTNSHVCGLLRGKTLFPGQRDTQVFLEDGRELTTLRVDYGNDLCVMNLPGRVDAETPLQVSKTAPEVDSLIYVLGHPVGGPLRFVSGTKLVDDKDLNAIGELLTVQKNFPTIKCVIIDRIIYQVCGVYRQSALITAQIFPGNSGSPVVNWLGNVVGVVWGYNPNEKLGYATSHEALVRILED